MKKINKLKLERKVARQQEMESGNAFISRFRIHKNKKAYDRKKLIKFD